jgi:hypothetical protein
MNIKMENKIMEITQEIAQKVLDTVNVGLVSGLGEPIPGKMCVEAAVCYAMGLPHEDNPPCVSPALRRLKISLNDAGWSSRSARANGLRELALLQLGSAGVLDEVEFAKRVTLLVINKYLPSMLRKANLNQEADVCEKAKDLVTASAAARAADAAYAAYVSNTTRAAAYASIGSARAASYAVVATCYATADAARAVGNAVSIVFVINNDKTLSLFAKDVAEILIDMKVPGIQWLNLMQNNFDDQKGILKYIMKWICKIIPRTF